MLKKTTMLIITLGLLVNIFSVFATDVKTTTTSENTTTTNVQTFDIVNNKGTIEVTKDTIFVGTTDKNTSIIDLFTSLNIDGKDVTDSILKNIDVRYVNPSNVDFKISSDTDIIDKDSKIYILFKTIENGGLVSTISTIEFELKNFKLQEIGTISKLENNSYTKIYNVNMKDSASEESITTSKIDETIINDTNTIINNDEKVIDNTILETNNTGITDNTTIIIISLLLLIFLLVYPNVTRFKSDK